MLPATATAPTAAKRGGGSIRLNAFQVLMRRWSTLHPYNAGQVMEVTGRADVGRWKKAILEVLAETGLGVPHFGEADRSVYFSQATDVVLEESEKDLGAFYNEELNRPFAVSDVPIRFCILPGRRAKDSHCLAAVYDHWIGDSRAMRELMHRLFDRYQNPEGGGGRSKLKPLTVEAPDFNTLFRKHVGKLTRWAAIRESIKNVWRHRHGFRVNIVDPLDFKSCFIVRQLPPGLITKVYRFAKLRRASVNDAFIALLGQAMGDYTAGERAHRKKKFFHFRRRQIGVGTIVDIRDAASQSLDQVFNLYLSSYTVLLDAPETMPPGTLTADVAARTVAFKQTFATVKQFWALVMARFWYDSYNSQRFRAQLLHKTVPVVAGISNVNMTGSWVDLEEEGKVGVPRVIDYVRISPTGPLIPLVFTLTTIAERLSLCVTYRTQSFSEEQAERAVDNFVKRMTAAANDI